ncbi:MAG: hypothetical protein LBH59_03605, partial [Planctomycetaceae bacterium]|nr:hypothetical protein [Planctomycetaceae bacterium]
MKRNFLMLAIVFANFVILQNTNFYFYSNPTCPNFCCADETEKNNNSNSNESIDKLMETGKYKDVYDILKKLILQPQDPQNRKYIEQHNINIAHNINNAVNSLQALNRVSEVDEFLEQALLIHKNDWRVLAQIAVAYNNGIRHFGNIIDNKFVRGRVPRGQSVNTLKRDYTQAMMIFKQAIPLALQDKNKNDVAQFFITIANTIDRYSQSNPQMLVDISQLPDYTGYDQFVRHQPNKATAVDIDGNPIFYNPAETFESAKNEAERFLWALSQAANICPENFLGNVLNRRADFNERLFGTKTLADSQATFNHRFYSARNFDSEQTLNFWALESLSDEETIADTALGIKRFKLSDEHNYIKLRREAYNKLTGQARCEAGNQLALSYSNRRQYVKAAEILRNIIKEFENNKSVYILNCRYELNKIIGNWGQFTSQGTEVNGTDAKMRYVFRNGKEVKLSVYEIDVKAHLDEIKSLREKQSQPATHEFRDKISLSQRLREINDKIRETGIIDNKNLTAEQARKFFITEKPIIEWSEKLTPQKNHFNTDTIINLPIKKSGLYFILATMENGNTVANIIWLNDTTIVQKSLNDAVVYLVNDIKTGEPIKDAEVEVHYSFYNHTPQKTETKFGKIITKTDVDGIAKIDKSKFPFNSLNDVLVIAKRQNKYTVMGDGYWYFGNRYVNNEQLKAFIITDRPVYRPLDKVEIKCWIGSNKYDQPDVSQLRGSKIDYKIYSPLGKVIHEQDGVELDSYGGFTTQYELPKNAQLGTYRTSIKISNSNNWLPHNGFFRVEEYKKPEYEVTIDSPKEPITLGDKFKVTIKAKYYFGSPVTEATVKYSVLRSTEYAQWYPVRYWDWLYGNGYSWFAYDASWLPKWSGWGCYCPSFYRIRYNYSPPEQVVSNETKIGADGTVTFEIDSSLAKAFFPNDSHKYSITAEVIDNSRRTITGQSSVLVAHEPFKIYAYTNQGFYLPNQKITASFQTRRIDGKPISGKAEANLYKLSYKKTTKNDKDEFEVTETKVHSENITFDDAGFAQLQLNAVEAGQYKILCKLNGQEGGYVFNVYPNSNEQQNSENNANELWKFNALELIPDKSEFAPGDNVNLRINTEQKNSYVYLLTRAENGIAQTIKLVKLNGKTTQIPIPVEMRDMPNFYVEAVTITDGQVFNEMKEIVVPPQKRVLNVEVQPDAENYKPAEKAKAKLIVTDLDGKPVVGQIAISIYDKSVEYISAGTNTDNIKEFFWKWKRYNNIYSQSNIQKYNSINMSYGTMRNIGCFSDIIFTNNSAFIDSIFIDEVSDMDYNTMHGGFMNADGLMRFNHSSTMRSSTKSVGGYEVGWQAAINTSGVMAEAKSDGAAFADVELESAESGQSLLESAFIDPAIRRNFADTAYWSGVIETDADGVANVEFTMPESLTTWKINVWSMAQGTRVGHGATQVITRKDLIIRMQTPRFLIEKDQVLLTANIHNYLKSDKNVLVQLEADGDLLAFDKNSSTRNIKVVSEGEAKIDWLVDAKRAGDAKIRMFAKTDEESDAMEKVLPIYVHGILKQESWSGYIAPDKNSSTIEINIPEERKPEQTKLTLRYSPTLAMSLVDALPYLVDYPYGCTEQTLNRFLPTVIVQKILIDMNIDLAKLEKAHANLNAQELGDNRKPAIAERPTLRRNPVYSIEEVRAMVDEGVMKLTNMQCSDGGWGWFGGSFERSSAHLTALVLHGLLIAKENDVNIDNKVFERGKNWLVRYQTEEVKKLQNYQSNEKIKDKDKKISPEKQFADTTDAFVLMVIGEVELMLGRGKNKNDFAKLNPNAVLMRDFIWRDRGKITLYGVSMFGIFESGLFGDMDRAKDCVKILEQYLVNDDENQTAYLNLRRSGLNWYWWCWYDSEFETQAYYLKLLVRVDAKNLVAPRLVKYLLNNRRHATYWNSTRDTAICVEAFAEYLRQTGESKPNITVDILFDGETKKTVTITPENLFEIDNTFILSGNEISSGKHKIEFKKRSNNNDNNADNSPLYFNAYLENFTLEDSIKSAGLEVKVERRLYLLRRDDMSKVDVLGNRGQVVDQRVQKYERVVADRFESGDLVEVELIVESKNDYESILVGDWKCAGFEPVEVRSGYNGNELGAYVEFRDERVLFFVYQLKRGKHSVTYRLRAEQPGNFSALPTQIEAMYAPELKG